MNIPLDRLYHYIESIAEEIYKDCVLIYRFWPHGSKNINDLNSLHRYSWQEDATRPAIWCHDQEPLDYEFYKNHIRPSHSDFSKLLKSHGLYSFPKNLNYIKGIFEKGLLLHSEKRSHNLEKYQADNELIPIYYWSHAIIARDWFRYAEHETFQKNTKKMFLIYNRAWSGTREYRLKFIDLLVKNNLISYCQTSCNVIEPELNVHYTKHTFKNPLWRPTNMLENFLLPTTSDATSSADFDIEDYKSTDIEVVLETLFDDNRLHLTEKSLRPIACGQPFVLVATHGSLEYLRSYGFKTFNGVWDERYDQITDPEERLIAVVDLMQKISAWDESTKKNKLTHAKEIADYNRQWFFSQEFFDLIVDELKINLKLAFNELEQCNNYKQWIDRWSYLKSHSVIGEQLKINQGPYLPTMDSVNQVMSMAQDRLIEVANNNKK
jgi:hypothetical protein